MKWINSLGRECVKQRCRKEAPARFSQLLVIHLALLTLVLGGAQSAIAVPELTEKEQERAEFIYFDRCSGCHGALRKGATGPNITAKEMNKKTLAELEETIFEGTEAGMPGWGRTGELSAAEAAILAKFMQRPAPIPPEMGLKAMKATHKVHVPVAKRPKKPQHKRDIDNYFGVILRDAGQAAIIDGDTKKMISVMDSGHAVHIFRASATGRYFYTGRRSRESWRSRVCVWMPAPWTSRSTRARRVISSTSTRWWAATGRRRW